MGRLVMATQACWTNTVMTENLSEEFDVQQTRAQNQLSLFFSLPERARATKLRSEIIGFKLRYGHFESDLSELMILKNRRERRRQADHWTMTS